MIDLSDVSAALVGLIASAVYPNGIGAASVTGKPILVYPGWPQPNQLEPDLNAGRAHVSVFPSNMERNTTAYAQEWQTVSVNPPTLTAIASGNTATFGGVVSVPQQAMIGVNGKPYIYAVQAADTLASIAAALAALVSVDLTATSSGANVTVPAATQLKAAIGVQGIAARELKRQAKTFNITVWANNYATRDAIAAYVDVMLAKTPHLPLPHTFSGHMTYKGSRQDDSEQKAGIFRRELMYEVDYPTVETESESTILGIQDNLNRAGLNGAILSTRIVWTT